MEYKLMNPSDPYTFLAKDREVAALTVFCISTLYGAKPKEGDEDIQIFIFGGSCEWYQEKFGRTPDEGLKERKQDVADALDSIMYGDFEDRRRYEAALNAITDSGKKEEFKASWQNRRSSLNDIGTYAHMLAKKLRI